MAVPHGLPILDATFDPNDATQLYVVPVAVESAYDIYGNAVPVLQGCRPADVFGWFVERNPVLRL